MEFFFALNGAMNYFSPDKKEFLTFVFDDTRNVIEVDSKRADRDESVYPITFEFMDDEIGREEYEAVKFLFLNYWTQTSAALDASEVWNDRENITTQSASLRELNSKKGALSVRRLKIELAQEELQVAEAEKRFDEMKKHTDEESERERRGRIIQ